MPIIGFPRTAAERQALWDAATDTGNPVSQEERDLMFAALTASDIAYICGFLPADAVPSASSPPR